MKIIKAKSYKELSKTACDIIIKEVFKKPNIVIGFATGSTPLELYKELVREYKKKDIDFSKVTTFNLDEYYPIKKNNKKSYRYYMYKNLFGHINIKKSNINLLNGEAKNPEKECVNYENKIKRKHIDIQILGVGSNGHIAFNEPGTSLNSRTRLITWPDNKKGLTMGIKTILSAKKIVLLASGKKKAKAIKQLIKGKIDKRYPVTYLKKHRSLILIIDKSAASLI